jgi:protein-disulfide isomerase
VLVAAAAASLTVAGVGGACGKKSSANAEDYGEIGSKFDDSEPAAQQREPLEGVDVSALGSAEKGRFEALVDKLASPCGKAHSLRTSKNKDPECKSAPFAITYLVEMLKDGLTDDEIREMYELRYKAGESRRGFKLSAAVPHTGPDDARVVLVEFYDYGCPSCARFKPILDETTAAFPADVVLYYKQFPLEAHEHSGPAAQAALAAAKQGKFKEMHAVLFENQERHAKDDLWAHAKSVGLDMAKFEKDFAAAEQTVRADKQEGVDAGISGTPTLYVNGKKYDGLEAAKYLKMWVDEELALK